MSERSAMPQRYEEVLTELTARSGTPPSRPGWWSAAPGRRCPAATRCRAVRGCCPRSRPSAAHCPSVSATYWYWPTVTICQVPVDRRVAADQRAVGVAGAGDRPVVQSSNDRRVELGRGELLGARVERAPHLGVAVVRDEDRHVVPAPGRVVRPLGLARVDLLELVPRRLVDVARLRVEGGDRRRHARGVPGDRHVDRQLGDVDLVEHVGEIGAGDGLGRLRREDLPDLLHQRLHDPAEHGGDDLGRVLGDLLQHADGAAGVAAAVVAAAAEQLAGLLRRLLAELLQALLDQALDLLLEGLAPRRSAPAAALVGSFSSRACWAWSRRASSMVSRPVAIESAIGSQTFMTISPAPCAAMSAPDSVTPSVCRNRSSARFCWSNMRWP